VTNRITALHLPEATASSEYLVMLFSSGKPSGCDILFISQISLFFNLFKAARRLTAL
jgi:hypothetical protein